MDLVAAENVGKDYVNGRVSIRALTEVSFRIGSGSFVSFVGPSGSGKTTLLNLIGCLDRPTSGRLIVAGTDVAGLDRRRGAVFRGRHLGFIFQDFNLIPVLTAAENVEYPLIMVRGVDAAKRRQKVDRLLDAVGMAAERDKLPDQLSGGQKQRVAIARALVTEPDLVLADEPTANLDSLNAGLIIRLMKDIKESLGTTFIFSTHDMRIVDAADVVHTLRDGSLVAAGGRDEGNRGEIHA